MHNSKYFILLIFLIFTACDDENNLANSKYINVSPDTIKVHLDDYSYSNESAIYISTAGAEVDYKVSNVPDWIIFESLSGKTSGDIYNLNFIVMSSLLPSKKVIAEINVRVGSKNKLVMIECRNDRTIIEPISLNLYNSEIKLNTFKTEQEVQIYNNTPNNVEYYIENEVPGLTIRSLEGVLENNGNESITFSIDLEYFPKTTTQNIIYLFANGYKYPINVVVTNSISSSIDFPHPLVIPYDSDTLEVEMENNNKAPLKWEILGLPDYVAMDTANYGVLYGTMKFNFIVDRAKLPIVPSKCNFILKVGEKYYDKYIILRNYKEVKTLFDYHVEDACFDESSNKIFFIDNKLNKLFSFNPEVMDFMELSLPNQPQKIFYNAKSNRIFIGAHSEVYIVDAVTLNIEKSYQTNSDCLDLVANDNNVVLFLETFDYEKEIWNIKLLDGQIHKVKSGIEKVDLEITNDGKYIYYIDQGTWPRALYKTEIFNDSTSYLYRMKYQGGLRIGDKLWLNRDNDRIFCNSGLVYSADIEENKDLRFTLSLDRWIETFSHSKNTFSYVITHELEDYLNDYAIEIEIYSSYFPFQLKSRKMLPGYIFESKNGELVYTVSKAKYSFINNNTNKYYMILYPGFINPYLLKDQNLKWSVYGAKLE